MKRFWKLWFGATALLALLAGGAASAAAPMFHGFQTVRVVLDGKEINADVPAVILEERTLLPVRALAEALGLQVSWDAQNQTALLKSNKQTCAHSFTTPEGITFTIQGVFANIEDKTAKPAATATVSVISTITNNSEKPYDLGQARLWLGDAGSKNSAVRLEGKIVSQKGEPVSGSFAPSESTRVWILFNVPADQSGSPNLKPVFGTWTGGHFEPYLNTCPNGHWVATYPRPNDPTPVWVWVCDFID
ncbi:copper amine oxidase N-terminal domain-containing protein [Kyrpidia tusciae]|uniref:Copper amine oxidase domain protein n=1 Tax=Kyrpidia tusciae (strain DSM 2912 / NBRC 15312 / T2) TaxID=562970 RepID=D5WR60_KYRT2|nr:copper amine oxidase N-terminal domain-containing protein [Kyrpidia tusciae]ADG06790.1 copper amine oxidase domain protein [Kyrpidia tusciae DSM 2912]